MAILQPTATITVFVPDNSRMKIIKNEKIMGGFCNIILTWHHSIIKLLQVCLRKTLVKRLVLLDLATHTNPIIIYRTVSANRTARRQSTPLRTHRVHFGPVWRASHKGTMRRRASRSPKGLADVTRGGTTKT